MRNVKRTTKQSSATSGAYDGPPDDGYVPPGELARPTPGMGTDNLDRPIGDLQDDPIPTLAGSRTVEALALMPAPAIPLPPPSPPTPPATTQTSDSDLSPDQRALAHGASTLRFTPEEDAILGAPIADEDVEIRPDGIVYLSHARLRRILNAAIGRGQWAIIPQGLPTLNRDERTVSRVYHLFVRGVFVKESMGEQEYYPNSRTMSYADALEGAESNALSRSCKALSVGLELWDKRWIEAWKARCAVKVKVIKRSGEVAMEWRRKDGPPLPGEQAPKAQAEPTQAPAERERPAEAEQPKPTPGPAAIKEESVTTTGGKVINVQLHPGYQPHMHCSKPKLSWLVIQALILADREGLKSKEAKSWAHDHLNKLASELGFAHYSLVPWGQFDALKKAMGVH